jgi:hypothetical protein
MRSVAAAFWAAILFSTVNLILSLLVIPESLDKVKQKAAQKAGAPVPPMQNKSSLKEKLLPLTVFAPRRTVVNGRMRKDWSMLWLASAVFLLFLAGVRNWSVLKILKSNTRFSQGVFQIKYLYAEHVFGWNAEQVSAFRQIAKMCPLTATQLGYYISLVSAVRALHMLLLMPCAYCHHVCLTYH